MVESKKPAAKQVSIAAFFSPKPASKTKAQASPPATAAPPLRAPTESPALINADAFTTPSPVGPAAGKRKRPAATRSAKKKLPTANDDEVVDLTTPVEKDEATKKKRGRKVSPSVAKPTPAKTKTKTTPVVRLGISPHEGPGDADDDSDDDQVSADSDVVMIEVEASAPTPIAQMEPHAAEVKSDVHDDEQPKAMKSKAKATKKLPQPPPAPKTKRTTKKDKETIDVPTISATDPPQTLQTPVLPNPVDPVVRTRVASYQQKIDDLTQLCDRLTHSKDKEDAVLLEIYGLGLDGDLDPATDEQKAEIQGIWRALNEDTGASTATVELPSAVKHFVARAIQSRSDSLTALVNRVSVALGVQTRASAAATLALEMEIKMLAQRTSYGTRPAKANLYEDTTAEALWCWEVNNIELHFSEEAQKTIKRLRKQRKRTGTQLKSLSRVLQLLHHSPIDEAKVGNEEAKIGKFVSQVESELLKARDREKRDEEKSRKEQEKAHALEEKRRLEHEKQLAKEEEKRRKEEEAEAERQLAEKRRKSLVSYFRSIDSVTTTNNSTSSAAVGGASSNIQVIDVDGSDQQEKMARMDQEVPYLVKDNTSASAPMSESRSGAALLQRQRALVTAHTGRWSSRRYRDEKLGIMKLLQFHENYRPAYYGTFSKRSVVFRRGRRPLAQYAKFDYSVDSEEEWEEEEPGESLSGADSDMDDDDEDQLDYGDDWLAYEDEVEYVDGEEHRDDDDVVMDEDGDGDDEAHGGSDATASRKRRRRRVAAENKRQKLTKLEPQLSGPFVCCDEECHDHLDRYAGEFLDVTPDFVSPLMKRAQAREEAARAATETSDPATPVVKKKAKAVAPGATVTTTKPSKASVSTVTHKPPVKRKITPQLISAGDATEGPATTSPSVATKTQTDKSEVASSAPRTSPEKSSLTGWLKPSASSTDNDSKALAPMTASTSTDEDASTNMKMAVEI